MRDGAKIAVVELAGELDIARKEELRAALSLDRGDGILLDLSDVELRRLDGLDRTAAFPPARNRNATCRSPSVITTPQLDRIVRYAGLYEVFDVFSNRDDARRHLEKAS